MDRKTIKRKIFLKLQVIELIQAEIQVLEQMLRETREQGTNGQPAMIEENKR